jgi:hypothetical protein
VRQLKGVSPFSYSFSYLPMHKCYCYPFNTREY